MEPLARSLRNSIRRNYSTARPFVPPAALRDVKTKRVAARKIRPSSPSFYTARPSYYENLSHLESAVRSARAALTGRYLLPLPAFARESLPPLQNVWVTKEDMGQALGSTLTTTRYTQVVKTLNELNEYHRIATASGTWELASAIHAVMMLFQKKNMGGASGRNTRKPVKFDQYGRSCTVGRRKTSTARVWMIPIYNDAMESNSERPSIEEQLGLPTIAQAKTQSNVTAVSVLVNNIPIHRYFSVTSDREKVIRPFKLTGLLAGYNVFAIVRGGGRSGQAGAISHAIAKGLAAHDPSVESILRQAKLMRRDPRMVERKKTGRPKARKAYTWVKR